MAWFALQSTVSLTVTFLVGLIVGWLVWGWGWQRLRVTESKVVHRLTAAYDARLAARDADLAASRAALAMREAEFARLVAVAQTGAQAAEGDPDHEHPAGQEGFDAERDAAAATAAGVPGARATTEGRSAAGLPAAGPEGAGARDDLQRVEGIGPAIEAALTAAGVTTYARLADADEATLTHALRDAGLRFAPSLVTWSRQARLLADGDEDGFMELADRLVGGREKGEDSR
jgi:predicted flap endonuclease-1-like 5' DNA nuclease